MLKISEDGLCEKIQNLQQQNKALQKEIDNHKQKALASLAKELVSGIETVDDLSVLFAQVDVSQDQLRPLALQLASDGSQPLVLLQSPEKGLFVLASKRNDAQQLLNTTMKQLTSNHGFKGGGKAPVIQGRSTASITVADLKRCIQTLQS